MFALREGKIINDLSVKIKTSIFSREITSFKKARIDQAQAKLSPGDYPAKAVRGSFTN